MCKYCDPFKILKFNESYNEIIEMDEYYNQILEEKIYLETYLYKPGLTNAIYLSTKFELFNVELPQRIRIKYCPFCGDKIEQQYIKQPLLFIEKDNDNE